MPSRQARLASDVPQLNGAVHETRRNEAAAGPVRCRRDLDPAWLGQLWFDHCLLHQRLHVPGPNSAVAGCRHCRVPGGGNRTRRGRGWMDVWPEGVSCACRQAAQGLAAHPWLSASRGAQPRRTTSLQSRTCPRRPAHIKRTCRWGATGRLCNRRRGPWCSSCPGCTCLRG